MVFYLKYAHAAIVRNYFCGFGSPIIMLFFIPPKLKNTFLLSLEGGGGSLSYKVSNKEKRIM